MCTLVPNTLAFGVLVIYLANMDYRHYRFRFVKTQLNAKWLRDSNVCEITFGFALM